MLRPPSARGPNSMRPWNQPMIFPAASCSATRSISSSSFRRTYGASRFLRNRSISSLGKERSEERRVGKGVDLGGRRIIKKKKKTRYKKKQNVQKTTTEQPTNEHDYP